MTPQKFFLDLIGVTDADEAQAIADEVSERYAIAVEVVSK